ncbi:MAG: PAS-domain containing protein [Boseongicola sp.]|nr:PAS-domain containing protein [Boseongicola sp.]
MTAIVISVGASGGLVALMYLALKISRQRAAQRRFRASRINDPLMFLINDGAVVDANYSGHFYLASLGQGEMRGLKQTLHGQFDDAEKLLTPSRHGQMIRAVSRDGAFQAISETAHSTVRLKIIPQTSALPGKEDVFRLNALEGELETLRAATENAPYLVWRESSSGVPVWVNHAYLEAVKKTFGIKAAREWPLPRLFPELRRGNPVRLSLTEREHETTEWFECHSIPLGQDSLFTAFNANSTVKAENQLREFMQTLTQTFAQLTIGLAIFDRSRNLALFNPSLNELTNLPVDFLARRPHLSDFLDKLREKKMMPEPRDYRSWRDSMAELEAAAVDGSYSETWSLPGNLTYRVTGRPHPDGAIAFLFEDISAEMTLNRHFRQEVEMGQALLDNMEDATAVFSSSGVYLQSNKAYRDLWGEVPDDTLSASSVTDTTRVWHEKAHPTPIWGDLRDFVLDQGDRVEWTGVVQLRDGRNLDCRFIPLSGGGTQVIFRFGGDAPVETKRLLEVV